MEDVTPDTFSYSHGDITLFDNYAIVVGGKCDWLGTKLLLIYDISNIEIPQLIAVVERSTYPVSIAVKDNYLYMSSIYYTYLLEVLDISNPLSPSLVTSIEMDVDVTKLKIINNYLYAMHSDGIKLFDIESPSSPYPLSEITCSAEDFDVVDGYLYIMEDWRLKIYEHQSPFQADYVKSVWDKILRGRFCISDGYAYVVDKEDDILHIIDIDPPEEASIVNSFGALPNGSYIHFTLNSIGVQGDYLYYLLARPFVGQQAGLFIYNISDKENPEYVSKLPMGKNGTDSLPTDMIFKDDYLLYTSDEGMRVVDISTPESADFTNEILTIGKPEEAYPDGDYLYLASSVGLQILDISTPETAYCVKSIVTPAALDVRSKNGYAYLADNDLGIMIIDVDPIEDAHVINTIEIPNDARDVYIDGNYLYVCGGLSIIDISDPENAFKVESVHAIGIAHDVAATNGFAYVADWPEGLQIVDVDPPDSPFIAGFLPLSDAIGVDVVGNHAFIADRFAGLKSVNVSNPVNPMVVGTIGLYGIQDVTISGGYAFVSHDGLKIVDISIPGNLQVIDGLGLAESIIHINVQDNYAYATGCNDLNIIKLW